MIAMKNDQGLNMQYASRTVSFYSLIQTCRPAFLWLTPACLLLPIGMSVYQGAGPSVLNISLIIILGLLAHISVNTFNEYFDFKSGLDFKTQKTPFSGGSGSLPQHPHLAPYVFALAVSSLVFSALIGCYFVLLVGWPALLMGLIGLLLVVFYTTHITRMPWLCLIAPGLAFGPIMMVGAGWVLTGQFNLSLFLISLISFLQVSNLLLLNQIPDIAADQSIGRDHIAIRFGRKFGLRIFLLFHVLAVLLLFILVSLQLFTPYILLGLIPMLPISMMASRLAASPSDDRLLQTALPLNVLASLLTPTIIGTVLWLSPP